MNQNRIRLFDDFEVYAAHDLTAQKIGNLSAGQIVDFNREKRRGGINWMEIILPNNTKGYLWKDAGVVTILLNVWLKDELTNGFKFKQKTSPVLPINELFFKKGHFTPSDSIGKIELKSVQNASEDKVVSVFLEYDKEVVEIEEFTFEKDHEFTITNVVEDFFEVEDTEGVKGFIYSKAEINFEGGNNVGYLGLIVGFSTVALIFYAFLEAGWIVFGGWMIIVGSIVAVIFMFIFMKLQIAFLEIKKRL